MRIHILVLLFILISLSPTVKALPDWRDPLRFWNTKQESSWEKAWSFSFNTACYIWEMWYSQVMVSKATTLLGQAGITCSVLAILCLLVYKLTNAIWLNASLCDEVASKLRSSDTLRDKLKLF
jgi:hypothetical protein